MKALIAIALILLLFTSAAAENAHTEILMSTTVTITLKEGGSDLVLSDAFKLCETYDALFSTTLPTSDISRLNRGETTQALPSVASLIREGLTYGALSGGLFDISIRPLSALWDFTNAKTPPNHADILAAQKHVDYTSVSVDDNTILLPYGTQIDLGGIAKGYISGKLRDYLITRGVTSGIISLGGNVVTIGNRADGSPFRIGLRKPFDEAQILGVIETMRYDSIITSGSYERCFTYGGVLYHHILDPFTGYPVSNDLVSVTIISNNPTGGDALSTIGFAMGLSDGLNLIENTADTEAIFVSADGRLHFSSGFADGAVSFSYS